MSSFQTTDKNLKRFLLSAYKSLLRELESNAKINKKNNTKCKFLKKLSHFPLKIQ